MILLAKVEILSRLLLLIFSVESRVIFTTDFTSQILKLKIDRFLANFFIQAEKISQLKNINLLGVMTILPYLNNPKDTQKLYAKTRQVQQQIYEKINNKCTQLSMGMSRDYVYALKEGATHIRLGTILYGHRP